MPPFFGLDKTAQQWLRPSAVGYTARDVQYGHLKRTLKLWLLFSLTALPFFLRLKHPKHQDHAPVLHTSWKSCDISHTRQEFDCISHLCLSERKKSRSSGVCVRAWTIQFMKHVLPRFINPRKPAGQETKKKVWEQHWKWGLNMMWFIWLTMEGICITTKGLIYT